MSSCQPTGVVPIPLGSSYSVASDYKSSRVVQPDFLLPLFSHIYGRIGV